MSQERIDMLKEMIEQSATPAGWIGYYQGKPATFLFKQEDVPIFLKNTDPVGSVVPLYTHPAKTLTNEEIGDFTHRMVLCCQVHPSSADINVLGLKFIVEDILRKAGEK